MPSGQSAVQPGGFLSGLGRYGVPGPPAPGPATHSPVEHKPGGRGNISGASTLVGPLPGCPCRSPGIVVTEVATVGTPTAPRLGRLPFAMAGTTNPAACPTATKAPTILLI